MTKNQALIFWGLICNYGDVRQEMGEVGNSGEFFCKSEWQIACNNLNLMEAALQTAFARHTGYMPTLNNRNQIRKLTLSERQMLCG